MKLLAVSLMFLALTACGSSSSNNSGGNSPPASLLPNETMTLTNGKSILYSANGTWEIPSCIEGGTYVDNNPGQHSGTVSITVTVAGICGDHVGQTATSSYILL